MGGQRSRIPTAPFTAAQAAAAHEFGQAFGLNHVSESSHGKRTMSPSISSCQNSESSLGLGDVRGLESKY